MIRSTDKGDLIIEKLINLPTTKSLTSVSQTAKLELLLQKMAEGETDDKDFIKNIEDFIHKASSEWGRVEEVKRDPSTPKKYGGKVYGKKEIVKTSEIGKCPICQSDVMDYPKSYSCSKWKEGCKFTIWKIVAKKKLSQTSVSELMISKRTNLIKGFKSKTGKSFDAYLKMDQSGQVSFEFQN